MEIKHQPAARVILAAVAVFYAIGLSALTWSSWRIALIVFAIGCMALLMFMTVRHVQLWATRDSHPIDLRAISGQVDASSPLRNAYIFVVLGSGGHTKEMLAMLEVNFPALPGIHRRYVYSSGDNMSLNHLKAFEDDMASAHGQDAGSYDFHVVPRARRVHQPLYTVPFSALYSVVGIFPLLWVSPFTGPRKRQQFPDIIMTNGPATGFFVAVTAWLLKVFYLAPEDAMQVVYIESWARIKTLSLTGKLFYWSGMADTFLVQHGKVAAAYDLQNAGCLVVKRPGMNPTTI